MTAVLLITGIILCIACSAFFSASEMSFSSVNELRMEHMSSEGDRKAGRVLEIIRNFDDSLSAILIGNNLVNIACSSLSSVLVIVLCGNDRYTWVATAVVTVLVIILGETIPKITAKKNANRFALEAAGTVSFLKIVFRPLIFVVTRLIGFLTKNVKPEAEEEDPEEAVEEFSDIIETAEDEGVLDEERSEMMQNALDFSDATAQECMTSRVDMQAIDIDDPIREILQFIEKTPYTRIPVYEDSVDNVIGVLHLNKLLKALTEEGKDLKKADLRKLCLPPCFVYKTMSLPTVLKRMRDAGQHLAIVTDEYGGTEGIITMEDVLEEIVGDIWDETDTVEKDVVQRSDGTYVIDGDMPIGDFLEEFGLDEDEFDFDSETVGGWVTEYLDNFPKKGDSFDYEDLHVEVLSMDGLRVDKVQITVSKKEAGDEKEA